MYWAEEDINNILIIAQLRLRLGLVLAFICSITSVNGLSYFVNTDYRNTTWCTFQVDPGLVLGLPSIPNIHTYRAASKL